MNAEVVAAIKRAIPLEAQKNKKMRWQVYLPSHFFIFLPRQGKSPDRWLAERRCVILGNQ
ncbi:hypothetical protein ASG93_16230 [Paenibacillus sp. Soil787]|nr:hypothetical protein ASG93_16230 [Paenibacillus sp. Soil787]